MPSKLKNLFYTGSKRNKWARSEAEESGDGRVLDGKKGDVNIACSSKIINDDRHQVYQCNLPIASQ
jgi:hypothetical protein